MAEGAGLGVTLDSADIAQLFGEDQARYLVAVAPGAVDDLLAAARAAGVDAARVGSFGGTTVRFGASEAAMSELSGLYRSAFATAVA